jgi:tetratricopeptide (TPR) repeat protein
MADDNFLGKGLSDLENNKRKKTRRRWEKLQKRFPADYRITHSLALLNYWEIEESKKNNNTIDLKRIKKSIGNWSFLLNNELFWESWRNERLPYYKGNIPKEHIEELRHTLKTQLENIIPKDHYLDILLENKTAQLFGRLAGWGRIKGLDILSLSMGPIMLKELNLLKKAQQLLSSVRAVNPQNNDFKLLYLYLSPLGKITFLLKSERIEDALAELGKVREKTRKKLFTPLFMEIFIESCIDWAKEIHNDAETVNRLEKVIKIFPDKKIKYELSIRYLKIAVESANENFDWNKAIKHLRRSLELFKSTEAEMNLAVCLNQRAIEKSNELGKRLEKLSQKPPYYDKNPLYNSTVYSLSWISCHYHGGTIYGQYIKKNMGSETYNMCMNCWNKEQTERSNILAEFETTCLKDLQEAYNLTPENDYIKRNLQDITKLISQIRASIQYGVK